MNYSWNPDMTRGVVSTGDLRGTFYSVSSEGPEPLEIVVGEGTQEWVLSDALSDFYALDLPLNEWPRVGIATRPAWSPDGTTIAFLASPMATQLEGLARANASYNLYFMSPSELQPQIILENIRNPSALEWSPDGQSVLIEGCMGLGRRCGLWIYRLSDNELHLISTGEKFYGANWLSNNEIIANYCRDQEELVCSEYMLMRYDVSGID